VQQKNLEKKETKAPKINKYSIPQSQMLSFARKKKKKTDESHKVLIFHFLLLSSCIFHIKQTNSRVLSTYSENTFLLTA
jgi:predicted ATP-dependent protease